MAIRGDITLAELHEIQATCRDYNIVDSCDTDCPYCFLESTDISVNSVRTEIRYFGTCRKS